MFWQWFSVFKSSLSYFAFFGVRSQTSPWTSKSLFTITQQDLFPWAVEQRVHDECSGKAWLSFTLFCYVFGSTSKNRCILSWRLVEIEIKLSSSLRMHHLHSPSPLSLFVVCWPGTCMCHGRTCLEGEWTREEWPYEWFL